MTKIIIHITKFIIATITALLFASCHFDSKSIKGSGNVKTEKRIVQGDFNTVVVSNAIDLVIEQSDKTEITVEADDNLIKEIVTKVEGNTLVVKCNFGSFNKIKSKRVIVKMPIIDRIEASSASSVKSLNILRSEDITLKTSSAANMDVNVESDVITCKTSSASTINIEGKALKLETSASSASTINAKKLLANTIEAHASSGATIQIHPIVSLIAKASSGANIKYNSSPKSIERLFSSGGSISQD